MERIETIMPKETQTEAERILATVAALPQADKINMLSFMEGVRMGQIWAQATKAAC